MFFELICPLCLRKVENKSLRCIDMISTATKKKAGQNAEHLITIRFQLKRIQQAISWHLSFTSLSQILTLYSTTYQNTVCIHLTSISITKNSLHQCKQSFFLSKYFYFFHVVMGKFAQQSKNILGNIQWYYIDRIGMKSANVLQCRGLTTSREGQKECIFKNTLSTCVICFSATLVQQEQFVL